MGININKEKKLVSPVFPKDYILHDHAVMPDSFQWKYEVDGETRISIVGGPMGLYGDGYSTFEYWDYRESEPVGYATMDEINRHFKNKPIEI